MAEFLPIVGPLDRPPRPRRGPGRRLPRGGPVAARVRVLDSGGGDRLGTGPVSYRGVRRADEPPRLRPLRHPRRRHRGGRRRPARRHRPDNVVGVLVACEPGSLGLAGEQFPIPDRLTDDDRARVEAARAAWIEDRGYPDLQSHRPETIAPPSPTRRSPSWRGSPRSTPPGPTAGDGAPDDAVGLDRLLTNVSIYWFTRSGATAARFLSEAADSDLDWIAPSRVPNGWTVFDTDPILRRFMDPDRLLRLLGRARGGRPLPGPEHARAPGRGPAVVLPGIPLSELGERGVVLGRQSCVGDTGWAGVVSEPSPRLSRLSPCSSSSTGPAGGCRVRASLLECRGERRRERRRSSGTPPGCVVGQAPTPRGSGEPGGSLAQSSSSGAAPPGPIPDRLAGARSPAHLSSLPLARREPLLVLHAGQDAQPSTVASRHVLEDADAAPALDARHPDRDGCDGRNTSPGLDMDHSRPRERLTDVQRAHWRPMPSTMADAQAEEIVAGTVAARRRLQSHHGDILGSLRPGRT